MEVTPRPERTEASDDHNADRKPYHAPVLRLRGTLSALTQAIGSVNGDAGQGMMA